MEKESLINALRERIGETDFNAISRRSVETIVEPMLPLFADDEKVTEETYAIPLAMLKSFIGQSRHEIAEALKLEKTRHEADKTKAVKDAVEAYKNSLKEQDPPQEPIKPSEEPKNDDVNAIIEKKMTEMLEGLTGKDGAIGKLSESFNAFINDYNAKRQQEQVLDAKERIKTALEGLGANNAKVIELAMRELDYSADKSYDVLLSEAKERYEALYKDLYANGSQPFAGIPGNETSDASFQSFIQRRQKEAERQAEDAKALRTKMM